MGSWAGEIHCRWKRDRCDRRPARAGPYPRGPIAPIRGMTVGTLDSSDPIRAQPAPARTQASAGIRPVPARAEAGLADLMAAALGPREPGWRLPRRSALARKYNVSLAEIDNAIEELARRSVVRRLPDGQLYRTSLAQYWIPIEGAGGLGTRLDPMGNTIDCQTRQVSRREAPQDVAGALRRPAGTPVRVVRCVWVAAGEPVAASTAYQPEPTGDDGSGAAQDAQFPPFISAPNVLPPVAMNVEMGPSQAAVARTLGLTPGHPVITVTVRFDDPATRQPAGLTVTVLKPELFRVTIDTAR